MQGLWARRPPWTDDHGSISQSGVPGPMRLLNCPNQYTSVGARHNGCRSAVTRRPRTGVSSSPWTCRPPLCTTRRCHALQRKTRFADMLSQPSPYPLAGCPRVLMPTGHNWYGCSVSPPISKVGDPRLQDRRVTTPHSHLSMREGVAYVVGGTIATA